MAKLPGRSALALALCLIVALCAAGCGRQGAEPPAQGLKDINGTRLFYTALGSGQPIVFVHGRSGSHRYFLPHVAPLADQYRLLLYDQRGTGASDAKLELRALSIDQFADDLDALRAAFGLDKITLVGHSWGAVVALFYAFKYQNHLDKLILVDAVPLTREFVAAQLKTVQQRIARLSPADQQTLSSTCSRPYSQLNASEQAECNRLDATLRFYDPARATALDTTAEANTLRNAATVQSMLATSFNRSQPGIEAGLKSIHVPTLLVHGDFDPIPVAASAYIQQHIAGAQLVVLKQSGHFPFVEQPEQFLAAVRAFMGGQAATPAR